MYAGGVNFTSLFFMNVYRIYISLLFDLFSPLCWWFDKKGERNFGVYICMYASSFSFPCFIQKWGEGFWSFIYACFLVYAYMFCLYKKRRSIWRVYLYFIPHLCIYVLFSLCISLNFYLFIVVHELMGSFYKAYV